jgi:hypothetical protein
MWPPLKDVLSAVEEESTLQNVLSGVAIIIFGCSAVFWIVVLAP